MRGSGRHDRARPDLRMHTANFPLILGVCACSLGLVGCGGAPLAVRRPSPPNVAARVTTSSVPCAVPGTNGRQSSLGSWQASVSERHIVVFGPGTRYAFTAFVRLQRSVILDSGEISVCERPIGLVTFASPAAHRRWEEAGQPSLNDEPAAYVVPIGSFSFLPTGTTLSYREIRRWSTSPRAIVPGVKRHLAFMSGHGGQARRVSDLVLLRSYTFLLGGAPISRTARRTILAAIRALHTPSCPVRQTVQRYLRFCVRTTLLEDEATIDPTSPRAIRLSERLLTRSRLYPDLTPGQAVEEIDFQGAS